MKRPKIHVGLEIGTSKTCIVVGETRADASACIIGVGEVPSEGIRKGEIENFISARRCIIDAWQLAQEHADVDILSVYLSVTGDHIKSKSFPGSYRLPDHEETIKESHQNIAREKSQHLDIPKDHIIVDSLLGGYSIDGGTPTLHPTGLQGRTLDINCHTIHAPKLRLNNSVSCVREVPLEVEDIVFAPIATAQAILNRQARESGALLIDIGAGTTDFVCYMGGEIIASGCIPVGGDTINQDIITMSEMRINSSAAEALKCSEGNAFGDQNDRSKAHYVDELGMHDIQIERGELNKIINDRLGDTLMRVRRKLPLDKLKRGCPTVYLSGGTSYMRGLKQLTEQVFNTKVFQPELRNQQHQRLYTQAPRYCTAIGLIRYAQNANEKLSVARKPGLFAQVLRLLQIKR